MSAADSPHLVEYLKAFFILVPPVITGMFAIYVFRRGQFFERQKHLNQELIKRRIKFYDDVAPNLNKLLCFYSAVGDWHNLNPVEIIKIKREIDREFFTYKYILSPDLEAAYKNFIETYFYEFSGAGQPAKLRIDSNHVQKLMGDKYDNRWQSCFDNRGSGPDISHHRAAYEILMRKLGDNIIKDSTGDGAGRA